MPEDKTDIKIYLSSLIPAAVEDVWKVVGPFDKLDKWLKLDSCTVDPSTGQQNQVCRSTRVWTALADKHRYMCESEL